jgi:hypothetical protein
MAPLLALIFQGLTSRGAGSGSTHVSKLQQWGMNGAGAQNGHPLEQHHTAQQKKHIFRL